MRPQPDFLRSVALLWLVLHGCQAGKDKSKKRGMGMTTVSPSPTMAPTITPRPTPKASSAPSPSPTITPRPTPIHSEEPTMSPTTLSPTPLESEEPTLSPTTLAPIPVESEEPTITPTTLAPTPVESEEPTIAPTSLAPTPADSESPTMAPTSLAPTSVPTGEPTSVPTTAVPTPAPPISPRPTTSPAPTASPTTLSPSNSPAPTVAPTLPRVAVSLSGLDLEISSVGDGGTVDQGEVSRTVETFFKEHLQTEYDSSLTSVNTQSAILQEGDTIIVATRGEAMFDPSAGTVPSAEEVEDSVADYISRGGDVILEDALQEVGVGEINSISLDGQVIPVSSQAVESQTGERLRRSGVQHPAAIAGFTVGGVLSCALLAMIFAKVASAVGGGGDPAEISKANPSGETA